MSHLNLEDIPLSDIEALTKRVADLTEELEVQKKKDTTVTADAGT